ncbi:MAG: hypothetical protein V9H25_06495 [Candidatus Competibacter sp.]
MLVKDIFTPLNQELLSDEIRSWFRELCESDWVKCNKDVDWDEYQERMAEEELANATK